MLAEGDAIAVELFERFNQVSMPNMSLTRKDVGALIEFMETETRRVATERIGQDAHAAVKAANPDASCCEKVSGTSAVETGTTPRKSSGRGFWVYYPVGVALSALAFALRKY